MCSWLRQLGHVLLSFMCCVTSKIKPGTNSSPPFNMSWTPNPRLLYQWQQVISVGFYPGPVLAFGYCHCLHLCLCVCINHLLVCMITHQPFKLKSTNLDQRCKTPCLRCLSFLRVIDFDLQGQLQLEIRILPHFELVCTINFQLSKLESLNLDQKCILVWLRSLLFRYWLTLIFKVKFY